ncbi:hypothetical protein ACFE04_015333 [Oxalis oulophora]
MATLQRSVMSFRRQGSSGAIWDEKYYLADDDKVEYRDLRPCQSTKDAIGMAMMGDINEESGSDSVGTSPDPISFHRSLSAPAKHMVRRKVPPGNEARAPGGGLGKAVGIPKPKLGK